MSAGSEPIAPAAAQEPRALFAPKAAAEPSLLHKAAEPLLALAGMAAASVAATWPLAAHLREGLAGGLEDTYMNAWHLWWMRRALVLEPQNPFFAPILHWPLGAEMWWHTLAPAKTAWGALLLAFMAPWTAYNVLVLATFVATGFTAWLLLRHLLTRGGFAGPLASAAAFAGACAFDFSRYHLAHAHAHLNLMSLEGLPLYLLFFLRYLDVGRRRDLAGLALSALYVILCDYYYFVYLALFSLCWVLADRWRRGPVLAWGALSDPMLRRAAQAGVATLLACSPILAGLLAHAFPAPLSIWHGDSDYYSDLLGFVLPDRFSSWLLKLPQALRTHVGRLPGNAEEGGYFLGLATPALCLYALRKGVPEGRRWLLLGVLFAVLSMGVLLSVDGSTELSPAALLAILALLFASRGWLRAGGARRDLFALTAAAAAVLGAFPAKANGRPFWVYLPMPYLVFKEIVPLFSRGGMPVRFELVTTISVAVLFAFAAAHLGRMLASRSGPLAGAALALALSLVPMAEYLDQPMELAPIPPHAAIFDQIAKAPPGDAVFTDGTVKSQFEQIFHGHPITYARLSRLPQPEAELMGSPLYRALHDAPYGSSNPPPAERDRMRAYLREHHIRWYVTHFVTSQRDRFVTEVLDGRRVYSDGNVTAYAFE